MNITKSKLRTAAAAFALVLLLVAGDFAYNNPIKMLFINVLKVVSYVVWRFMPRKPKLPKPDNTRWHLWANLYLSHVESQGKMRDESLRDYLDALCNDAGLIVPTDTDIVVYEAKIKDILQKAGNFKRAPAIALVRTEQGKHSVSNNWLGGVPTMGTIAWPRGADGLPLHHAA